MMYMKKIQTFLCKLSNFLLFVGLLLMQSAKWYKKAYGNVLFSQVLYHLFSPLEGTDTGFLNGFVKECLPLPILVCLLYYFGFSYYTKKEIRHSKIKYGICDSTWIRIGLSLLCVSTFTFGSIRMYQAMGIDTYVNNLNAISDLYELYYTNPKDVDYTFPSKKRNLIYIYLESMELTFMDEENGGLVNKNIIPELTKLQNENLTFNGEDSQYNGFYVPSLNRWTIAGIVGTTSGLPMNIDWSLKNSLTEGDFLGNAVTLGDILYANGYVNEFMCGSDIAFGGRKNYLSTHGNYEFFDLYTAKEKGYIPQDYGVWWGFEDEKLFTYAKEELTRLSKENQPFNFNVLTADTHYPNGYECEDCQHTFDKPYSNVMACSSKRVYEFVKWIQQQDFYKNTTIVISSDHTTMDTIWFEDVDTSNYQRKGYYTILNSSEDYENKEGRMISTYDLFPTTLASMGVKFNSNRLGFGTNLYTDEKTLIEVLGFNEFDRQLALQSNYYDNLFNGRVDLHQNVKQPPKGEERKPSKNTQTEDDFEKGEAQDNEIWQNVWPQFM